MESVEDYIAYHISHVWYESGLIFNTESIRRTYDGDDQYKKGIEVIAEKDRLSLDSSLPSRDKCLFVCEYNDVRYWYNYMQKRRRCLLYIYKIKLRGNLLWTYAEYLRTTQYWKPANPIELVEHEGLFIGYYKIISECSINDFPQ